MVYRQKVQALRQPDITRQPEAGRAAASDRPLRKGRSSPENPLLPHDALRDLHTLMLHCKRLEHKLRSPHASREAFLAGTTIHLGTGDLLSAPPKDTLAAKLAPEGRTPNLTGKLLSPARFAGRLPLCAAAARGMQAAHVDRLVVAFVRAGSPESYWKESIEWAQQECLPLILACSDATGGVHAHPGRPSQYLLDFTAMSRLAKRLKLPVLTVDGEDAVAVYRVMQECTLRARHGGGPAVLWAALTMQTARPTQADSPLARMEQYMAARNIRL